MKNGIFAVMVTIALCGTALRAADFQLPFGLPVMRDARLLITDSFDSPSGDREESITRFATNASPQDIDAFYRGALEAVGFKVYSGYDKGDRTYAAGKRDRDRITVSAKSNSAEVEPGEVEILIVAKYDK